jgi:hypothetical protein
MLAMSARRMLVATVVIYFLWFAAGRGGVSESFLHFGAFAVRTASMQPTAEW